MTLVRHLLDRQTTFVTKIINIFIIFVSFKIFNNNSFDGTATTLVNYLVSKILATEMLVDLENLGTR